MNLLLGYTKRKYQHNMHAYVCLLLSCMVVATVASSSFPILNPAGLLQPSSHSPNSLVLAPVSLPPRTVVVARRQMEMLPPTPNEVEPSCSELRLMWRRMRRMSRQMEFTNEIPKMQDPFVSNTVSYDRRPLSKYPNPNPYSAAKSSKDKVFQKSRGQFGKILKDPTEYYGMNQVTEPRITSGHKPHLGFHEIDDTSSYDGRIPGRFADTSLPEESLGVYGTVVHSPAERARFRARSRRPPEYGLSKYRWSGDSTGIGRIPFRAAKPHDQYHYGSVVTHGSRTRPIPEYPPEIGQRYNGGIRVGRVDKISNSGKLKNSCLRLQNQKCKTDVDCYCSGSSKLFCGGNRCRPTSKLLKYTSQPHLLIGPFQKSFLLSGAKTDPVWQEPY